MDYKKFWGQRTSLEKILLCCVLVMCLVILIIFISFLSSSGSVVCNNTECVRAAIHILDHVDPSVDPCQNFYNFACGSFLKNSFLRKKATPLATLSDLTKYHIREILVENTTRKDLPHSLVIQRNFYRSCMNTSNGKENEKTILNLLDNAFGGWPVVKSYSWNEKDFLWTKAMMNARHLGLHYKSLMVLGVYSRELGDNLILWLKPPSRKNVERYHWKREHVDTMVEIATLLGAKSISVTSEIRRTVDFANQLEEIVEKYSYNTTSLFRTDEDDDTKDNIYFEEDDNQLNKTITDIKLTFMQINWLDFLRNITGVQVQEDTKIFFGLDDYLRDLYHLLIRTPKRVVANYMAWNVIVENIAYLSEEINEKYQNLLKVDNEPIPKREELCITLSRKLYRNVVEAEYVRRSTTSEKKKYIMEMMKYISNELELSIKATSWMHKDDIEFSLDRLREITTSLGWLDIVFNVTKYEEIFGYDQLKPLDNVVDLARMANKVRNDRFFEQVMENMTEIDLMLDSPKLEVNAYYIKLLNKLILPAPILQNHIFEMGRPHYMNYGALGTVIGHEFGHGFFEWYYRIFDSNDGSENDTIENYKERANCIMDEYQNYEIEKTRKNLTDIRFEENFADYYGLELAYRAYQKWIRDYGQEEILPGIPYTPNQIFWIMTSTYMCLDPRYSDEKKDNLDNDLHGLPSFRVIGRLRSSYEFAKDFQCSENSYMNPKKKCHIYA